MPFKIENNDEAFHTNQSIWMESDIDALAAGINSDGVLTGCAVTAQGTPDMTVAVAVGTILVSGVKAEVTAGNVTITTADATNPRIDLIVVSNAGVKSATAGTAAASPKAPAIPASSVLLAMVYVPAADTTIASNQITDKRVNLGYPKIPRGRVRSAGGGATTFNGVPGLMFAGQSTMVQVANRLQYIPFFVEHPVTIDRISFEVTTLIAASNVNVGIFHADEDYQPVGAAIAQTGSVSSATTGVKDTTLGTPVTLQPGRYLIGWICSHAPTLRSVVFLSPLQGLYHLLGTNIGMSGYYVASTYNASIPNTVWDTTTQSTSGLVGVAVLRTSDPSP